MKPTMATSLIMKMFVGKDLRPAMHFAQNFAFVLDMISSLATH
jgi:hypothetical protein